MSFTIVDKRNIGRDRTVENRQRFLKRIRQTIKDQLPDIIAKRSLKDIGSSGADIKVNRKTIGEPTIHGAPGGTVDRVAPGNDTYVVGDMVPKPYGSRGRNGREAGEGESEDDFIVEISRDEFLKYFFEDLELPHMIANELAKSRETKRENAGFTSDGPPARLNVLRSYKQSLARKLPLRSSLLKEIEKTEQELAVYENPAAGRNNFGIDEAQRLQITCAILELQIKLDDLKHRLEYIPLFEEMDLRYRAVVSKDVPSTHATMIMIMDNSGSMQEREKTIARKFFWLLYSFLIRQYDEIELRFVSHTDEAEEMNEEEFFTTTISGGTLVSTALDLTAQIINEDLIPGTNVYVAQVSDGDNFSTDNGTCAEILEDDILPKVRYFAYVQVDDYHEHDDPQDVTLSALMDISKGLWKAYTQVMGVNPKLQAKRVHQERDIYPVFRAMFQKKVNKENS